MVNLTMKQVKEIMGWSEPTARKFVREFGMERKSPNPPYHMRWEVDNILLLERIKQHEKAVMDKKSRFHAALRKQGNEA